MMLRLVWIDSNGSKWQMAARVVATNQEVGSSNL